MTEQNLLCNPGFLARVAQARASIQAGRGVRIEDLDAALNEEVTAKVQESSAPPARAARASRGTR